MGSTEEKKYKPGTANVDGSRPDSLTRVLTSDSLDIGILFFVIIITVSRFILPPQIANKRNIPVPTVSVL